jgi:hypothetical protein
MRFAGYLSTPRRNEKLLGIISCKERPIQVRIRHGPPTNAAELKTEAVARLRYWTMLTDALYAIKKEKTKENALCCCPSTRMKYFGCCFLMGQQGKT